jgi:DNA polymerase delta subunit 1
MHQTGHSVLLHVTDFQHYLYVAAPVDFDRADCHPFKTYLETQLAQHQTAIHSVQLVMRENIFGFQGNEKHPYLKITVADPKFIHRLRSLIEQGNANYKALWRKVGDGGVLTFDSIQYVMRFMIDTGVCWAQQDLSTQS